jgi:hypothetical protein
MKYFRIACSCLFFVLGPATVQAGLPPFDIQGVAHQTFFACNFEVAGVAECDREANLIAMGDYDSVEWQFWNWQIWYDDGSFVVGGWQVD